MSAPPRTIASKLSRAASKADQVHRNPEPYPELARDVHRHPGRCCGCALRQDRVTQVDRGAQHAARRQITDHRVPDAAHDGHRTNPHAETTGLRERAMPLSSSHGQVLRHPSGQPAAARDRPDRRYRARRRRDRLPDGLLLRAGVPARQPGRHGQDQVDPRPRRPASPHAGVPGLRPARPVHLRRQPGVPGDQGGNPRQLHLHPARDQGGAAHLAAPEEEDRRGADPAARGDPRRCSPSSASRSSRAPCCCPARTSP